MLKKKTATDHATYFFFRYRAVLYPCPDTAAERQEMAIGVNKRIENIQTVSALF